MIETIGPTQVSLEFSLLQKHEITADMYVLLFCRYHDNCVLPPIIKESILDDNLSLDYLENKDFIKVTGDKEFSLRQKAIDLFESNTSDKDWLEFLGTFPTKVPDRNGGTRALKIANPDSKGNISIKKKYISLTKSKPGLHARIIKVLDAEMEMRRNSNEMKFMSSMDAWLNQAMYDKYEYLLDEEINNNTSSYGQEIV